MEFRNDLINDRHTHVKHPDEARLPKINSESGPATSGKSSTNSRAMSTDTKTGGGSLLPKEKSPLLGSYSFVDVFVERVGKFLAQYVFLIRYLCVYSDRGNNPDISQVLDKAGSFSMLSTPTMQNSQSKSHPSSPNTCHISPPVSATDYELSLLS